MKKGKYSLIENKGFFFKHRVDIKKIISDAEKGNPEAQQSLAACYLYGLQNFEVNQAKGFQLASESAKQGLAEGLGLLGICYKYGLGTDVDEKKAFECFELAAKKECDFAFYLLGVCYFEGIGVEQNVGKGLELLEKSVAKNDEDAINYLADIYQNLNEPEEAFKLFKKGKKLGNNLSQIKLGCCYIDGTGIAQDGQKGLALIEEVAEKKDADALHVLGYLYENGIYVDKDPDIAKIYYKKAAENGYVEPESSHKSLKDYFAEKIKIVIPKENAINYKNDEEKIETSVVYIESESGSGSGFIISPDGFVATCAHVVVDAKELHIKVTDENNERRIFRGTIVKLNEETDTAIIKLENASKLPFVELDDREEAKLGEDIVILGYPLGSHLNDDVKELNISFNKGYVSSNQIIEGRKYTMLDLSAKHGNSGSPIISCKTGKIIGLLSGGLNPHPEESPTDEINYMRPICYLWELIKEVNANGQANQSELRKNDNLSEEIIDLKEVKKQEIEPKQNTKPTKKWADVKRLLRKEYKVAGEENDFLAFDLSLENGRTQTVCVERTENEDGIQWIMVYSCVGLIDNSEINEVLKMIGEYAFGGLVKTDDKHFVKYSLLLESASELSLLRPINTIAQIADEIEEKYIGGDQY